MGDATPPRIRRDVQSLVNGDATDRAILDAYATAVRKMRELDEPDGNGPPTNPLSWRYQAALHGIRGFTGDPLWSGCRHNSWFFLAWHRMYLYRFESIIQHHLGDPTWALPYWDYTKPDDEARKLPLPFREPTVDNPLFVPGRSGVVASGTAIDRDLADVSAPLRLRVFALPQADAGASFGGGILNDIRPLGDARGALENDPHADMHTAVGGLMGRFSTAALDPIFWLHHANIDRLWEVWRGLGNANSTDRDWLRTTFSHYDTTGTVRSMAIEEVLETRPLGHVYESTAPPADFEPVPVPPQPPGVARRRGKEVRMPSPELVGAVTDISLGEPTTVAVDLVEPRRRIARAAGEEERWFLRVEGIQGDLPEAAAFALLLQSATPGEEAIRVGSIGAFGIEEASQADDTHDGTGLTDVFDITEHVRALEGRGAWDAGTATVRIVPVDAAGDEASGGNVRARRVSIYRG